MYMIVLYMRVKIYIFYNIFYIIYIYSSYEKYKKYMCAHLIKEAINVCVDRSDWVLKNNIIEKYFQGMNSYIF